jgi:DNA-binding winged helix-turn-helix (wHTH) protein/tetratricopeptide (TPR) repeat protein
MTSADPQDREGRVAGIYRFGDFELDLGAYELRRGPAHVPVEPLVLDLLARLVEQPGIVLTHDNLIETVWNGRIVSDSTISTAVKSARKALGDNGRDQKYIRTVRGRGIQFAVPVVSDGPAAEGAASDPAAEPDGPGAPPQPVLYIRPCGTLGDKELDHPARAMRVRAGSILTRTPLLKIAAPFPAADQVRDPRELRARYGVTHVLELRLERAGDALAADAVLVETLGGIQVWAQRFETPGGVAEQEVLLHEVVRVLEPRLMQAMVEELRTAAGRPDARAHLLQAIALLALKGWHRTTFSAAAGMIEKAIALDPDFALAHAHLALIRGLGHRVGLLRDDDAVVPSAIRAAERALELDSQDSTILGLAGCALADVGQLDRGIPILKKAIERDPRNGQAKAALGAALMLKNEFDAAVEHLADGLDCCPADNRRSVWGAVLALGHLARGDLERAEQAAERACREDDRLYLPRLALAAIHLVGKNRKRAAVAVAECLRTKPDLRQVEVSGFVGESLGAGVWALVRASGRSGAGRPPAR